MAPCNRSIKKATRAEWDAWATALDEDGIEQPATHQDLLNRGVIIAFMDATEVIYHCGALDTERRDAMPGEVLSEGRARERHVALPDEATKRRVYGARVFRAEGVDLRAECNAAVSKTLAARVPANGSRSAKPADPEGAMLVLAEAERRAADEDDPTRPETVAMAEVLDSDVVAEDAVIRVRWAGEVAS